MARILLDCDGVISDFGKGFLKLVFEATGKSFTVDQITTFDIQQGLGLTPDEVSKTWALMRTGFCIGLDPIPEAVEAVQRLALEHEIFIVTSPLVSVPTWTSEREQWIKHHLGFKRNQVVHTSAKQVVRGDIFVDDKPENCWEWSKDTWGAAVIWEQPYNMSGPTQGCRRFNDWGKLEKLAKEYR